jgi:hypothetical protein
MRRRLDLPQWPSLARFFRGYLHQDAAADHRSLESAFDQFWQDASHDEQRAFGSEWRALAARMRGQPWHKVQPLIAALGAQWLPRRGSGFAALVRHVDRRLTGDLKWKIEN